MDALFHDTQETRLLSLNDGFGEETRQCFWVILEKNSALITFFYTFAHFTQYFLRVIL